MNEDRPDLRALARAAGLEIGAEDEAALSRRLRGMLEWIAILEREEALPAIEAPDPENGDAPATGATAGSPAGRDPSLDETLARETLRALAPRWVDEGFCVPRVRGKLP